MYKEYTKIFEYCNLWLADCYVFKRDFSSALQYAPNDFNIMKHAGIAYKLTDAINEFSFENLTEYGKANFNYIKEELLQLYEEFEANNSISTIEHCTELIEEESYRLFSGAASSVSLSMKLDRYLFNLVKFKSLIPNVIRTAENNIRTRNGLPKIGEGWLSETQLYYEIKNLLVNNKIIQHAKLKFLGKQHLDIYIPELSLAIEYQGLQHSQPIDYFGGEEAFKKTVERDNRKKRLCNENKINLIYVYPHYDIDSVALEIKDICKANGINIKINPLTTKIRTEIQNIVDKQYFRYNTTPTLKSTYSQQAKTNTKLYKWLYDRNKDRRGWNHKEILTYENHYKNNLLHCTNSISKYYWYDKLRDLYYTFREYDGFLEHCITCCNSIIELYVDCKKELTNKKFDNNIPQDYKLALERGCIDFESEFMRTFKCLTIIHEKLEEYDNAIIVCEKAINLGIDNDGTKSGFIGRKLRLSKKLSSTISS